MSGLYYQALLHVLRNFFQHNKYFQILNVYSFFFFKKLESELDIYSWFNLAILICPISFGHSAEQAPVLVHEQNPSSSIVATILATLSFPYFCPCGNKERCETLADVNNIAEEFLQAATQAPQPMQADERNASSAYSFSMEIVLASGASPVLVDT